MKTLKSHLLVALVLAALVFSLCACGKKPDALINEADAALDKAPYTINMKVEFESTDPKMADALEKRLSPSLEIAVDGEKFTAKMDMESEGVEKYIKYVFVDGVLYAEIYDGAHTASSRLDTDEVGLAEITESIGAGTTLNPNDFEVVGAKTRGDTSVITCTEIKEESLEELILELEAEFESLGATVSVEDVALVIQIENGKYHTSVLSCKYVITTDDGDYSVDMTLSAKYDYESDVNIVAP